MPFCPFTPPRGSTSPSTASSSAALIIDDEGKEKLDDAEMKPLLGK
jgi:hypothetical protein